MATFRLTLDAETAGAVEDALSYYLTASSQNFGAGYEGEDQDDVRQLLHERGLVSDLHARIAAGRMRIEGR